MEFAVSVSELTTSIKRTLEDGFENIKVIGEISNFKSHVSGHWYFTLKDKDASLNCTMWKGINNYVFFTPKDGMQVILTGRITVYPPRGTYQLDTRSMKPAGEGELQKAFEYLKRKLSEEGLFDEDHKKQIPQFPKKIGIVTGADTAALRDMLSVAQRRYPIVELIIAPARVQGEGAANEIAEQIANLNKQKDIDLIIISRGGGSLEDLWAFNEEIVAREIFSSKIPIISGVGHEVDFTIADFVADLRAPTPSVAMEMATPNKDDIIAFIDEFSYTTKNNIESKIDSYRQIIQDFYNSYGFRNLNNLLNNKKQSLDNYFFRIQNNIGNLLTAKKNYLMLTNKIITANNVDSILKKGFTIIRQNNRIIARSKNLDVKKNFNIKFGDGEVEINNE